MQPYVYGHSCMLIYITLHAYSDAKRVFRCCTVHGRLLSVHTMALTQTLARTQHRLLAVTEQQ
jgi:hypothetical protein